MISEIPSTLALWSEQNDHAGFVLFAPGDEATNGDCVFMLSPISSKGIDSDLGLIVSELKVAGEHPYQINVHANGIKVTISPEALPELVISFDSELTGTVVTEYEGNTSCVGTAIPVEKNA